jgi:hypothetical protein
MTKEPFIKIRHKLATFSQPFRQKLGGLKPSFYCERCTLPSKKGGLSINAYFQIFYLRRIGVTRIVVCFKRLSHRRREQFAV